MIGSRPGVGEPAQAGSPGGRLTRRLIAAAVVAGTATACVVQAEPEAVTSAASPSSTRADAQQDVTQIRAEVRYSPTGDLPAEQVAVGLHSSVELAISGNASGPVHLRGYERYAELVGGSTVLRFVATEPGCFVVEHDETGRTIAEVEVIDPNAPSASQRATHLRSGADPVPQQGAQCG